MQTAHELELTDRDFDDIRRLLKSRAGIDLGPNKRALVVTRLSRRLRELELVRFKDYVAVLQDEDHPECGEFLNALTTNVTHFFRENHHFEALERKLLREIYAKRKSTGRVRIWSAGCSSGEEPYSIAMTLAENPPPPGNWDIRVLATDLDSNVLDFAQDAIYSEERVSNISPQRLRKWFARVRENGGYSYQVSDALRDLISFRSLNLMGPWPMKGPFDMIFCRNVMIYFDQETKMNLADRYASMLAPGGYLFLGHSETLVGGSSLVACGRTMYRKPESTGAK